MLLYQINRNQNVMPERIKEHLTRITEHQALPIFLMCEKTNNIVITGGSKSTLIWVKNWFEQHMAIFGRSDRISVSILESVVEYDSIPKGSVVICLSNIVFYYLRGRLPEGERILTVKEIFLYYYYRELEDIYPEAILNYFQLFEYDSICIQSTNIFLNHFIEKIRRCGIKVIDRKKQSDIDVLQTDIFVYSNSRVYEQRILLDELYNTLLSLQGYYNLTGKFLEKKNYVEEFIECIGIVIGEGDCVCIQPNPLEKEVYQLLSEMKGLNIISLKEQYYVSLQEKVDLEKEFYMPPFYVIQTILSKICCGLLRRYCNNVYLHIHSFNYRAFAVHPERVISNYIDNRNEYFPSCFTENTYGEKDYPVEQIFADVGGCFINRLNMGYLKYQSNYHSQFFNTDTYGCRVVTDVPQSYIGTIYLLGPCTYNSPYVKDSDTVASVLQRRINQAGINYRIVNLSMVGGFPWMQISRLFEMGVENDDIIVIQICALWNKEDDHTIFLDKVICQLDEDEYWDVPWHCGIKGTAILADQIFDIIKPALHFCRKKNFYLKADLEDEINIYLAAIKERIGKKEIKDIRAENRNKIGAIVMSCNLFTYSYQYFVETASRLVDVLYIFVVEEDKPNFLFTDCLHMVEEGTKSLFNVIVLPYDRFRVSSITFPGYFMKESEGRECYDSFLDLKIFAHYIAPALGITMCFVWEGAFSQVTAQYKYSHDIKLILGTQGINVIEIPEKSLVKR